MAVKKPPRFCEATAGYRGCDANRIMTPVSGRPHSMNSRQLSRRGICVAVMGMLLGLSAPAPATADSPYREGEIIEITGAVTDADGNAQAGKTVVLQVYRRTSGLGSLNPRQFGRSKKGLVDRTTTTEADGRYLLQWPWHDYYNRFELSVGDFTAEGFEVIEKVDLSRRMPRGSPVIISFILGDGSSAPVAESSPAATATGVTAVNAAQQSVLEREGEPDLVDTLDLPHGREITWWYFGAGKAYRFLDGELSDELAFDPVRSN